MLLGDLMTISQYQIPVKIIIFNNRSLGMVKLEMRVEGYKDWQTDMVNPDFVKLLEPVITLPTSLSPSLKVMMYNFAWIVSAGYTLISSLPDLSHSINL